MCVSSKKSMSDGESCVVIVLIVSLVFRGEAVTKVRISQVLVYVVARTTHTNLHSSSITYRLWRCRSTSALIVRLGATPIYAPFGSQCNFMVSIIKHLPALELFYNGA